MRRLVPTQKSCHLGSGSCGSFVIDFSWARFSVLACVKFGITGITGITGMKLILREEIRLRFYTNAQMFNVYIENWKDHKKG